MPPRAGSSPLTRGKLADAMDQTRGEGLIPAHAGKTRGSSKPSRRWPAHPRSRGENQHVTNDRKVRAGSSPLTRGKLHAHIASQGQNGLIPAHAGKTAVAAGRAAAAEAHPRSRGENELNELIGNSDQGSSPLTRGKRSARAYQRACCGLIPAHAGKTSQFLADCPCGRAHPRSRGENPVSAATDWALIGSSPLTRGKHLGVSHGGHVQGLIPAHAGKT